MQVNKVLTILDEAKKAVHAGSVSLNPDGDFKDAMSLDGELYIVRIEKYVPIAQRLERYKKLLNNTVATDASPTR